MKAGEVSFDWPAIQKRKDKVILGQPAHEGGLGRSSRGGRSRHLQGTAKKLDGH